MNFQTSWQTTYPADPQQITSGKINIKPYRNSQPSLNSSCLCLSELAIRFPCLLDSVLCLSQQLVSICCLPSACGSWKKSCLLWTRKQTRLGEEGCCTGNSTGREYFMEQPTVSSMDRPVSLGVCSRSHNVATSLSRGQGLTLM